jgi:predicted permease
MKSQPPHLAAILLRLALSRGEVKETILGDLLEEFRKRTTAHGAREAARWYWKQAAKTAGHAFKDRLAGRSWSRPDGMGNRRSAGATRRWKAINLDPIRLNLRHTVRQLSRRPGFTFVVVFTLALGIGANSAIFTIIDGVLLTPLPFDEPDRLVGVWHTAPGYGFDQVVQSPAFHYTYIDEGSFFEELGMWNTSSVAVLGANQPEQVAVVKVTEGTLEALRVPPFIGRRFTAEEDSPAAPKTVILSYSYWQSHFAGDPGVIGQTLRIDGRSAEIIGVMPREFRFLGSNPSLILPFQFDQAVLSVGDFSYRALARLAPGVTIEQANDEINRLIPLSVEKFPGGMTLETLEHARFAAALQPLMDDVVGNVGEVLWVLMGTVGIVLLIAGANVANLFLVRAEGREREVAVRTAMGAGRGQVAGQWLTESVVLGVLGGLVGLGLATGGLRVLKMMESTSLPRLNEIHLDTTVLIFTFGISILVGLFFGLFPVFKYRRSSMVSALKEGGRGFSSGRERHRTRNTFAIAQMALALVLMIGSGLMIRSFQALRKVDPGFRSPQEVLTLRLNIAEAEVPNLIEASQTHERIARSIAAIPGVESVGLSTSITMDGFSANEPIHVEDFPTAEGQNAPFRRCKWIGEGYFATMQNPMVAGRDITWADIHNLNPVVVVTENFVREHWDTPLDALGKRVSMGLGPGTGGWREIVGVVGNVRDDGMSQDPSTTVFWPMVTPNPWFGEPNATPITARRTMAYAIRSPRATTGELLREVREAIWAVNRNLPLASVRTLQQIQETSMSRTSFTLVMLGIAAGVALLLGTIGIYGVISYIVSQRTHEIGVRIALGAETGNVAVMVLRQGLTLAVAGVAIGVVSALGLTKLMSVLLYGVSPTDPITFVVMSISLVGIALLASYLPARRAAATDPVEALRAE